MKKKYVFSIALLFLLTCGLKSAFSQGCSDAGACSITGHFADSNSSKTHFSGFVSQSLGSGEKFVVLSQSTVGVAVRFSTRTTVSFQIPFVAVYGNLGFTSGMGDGMVSIRQQLIQGKNSTFYLLAGGRLRSNRADLTLNSKALPMAYQTSLGTYDLILGLLAKHKTWDFYLAYQHSFGRNRNGYLHEGTNTNPNKVYYESANLKRGDDMVFRIQKAVFSNKKRSFRFTLMPVYRLQQDEIIKNGENIRLAGSSGFTLNINLSLTLKTKKGATVEWLIAFPIIDRKYRADGLTRNGVVTFRYSPEL